MPNLAPPLRAPQPPTLTLFHLPCHLSSAPPPPPCRYRHLMNDLIQLLPHCKKDNKLDTKNDRNVINEVADMKVWRRGG